MAIVLLNLPLLYNFLCSVLLQRFRMLSDAYRSFLDSVYTIAFLYFFLTILPTLLRDF